MEIFLELPVSLRRFQESYKLKGPWKGFQKGIAGVLEAVQGCLRSFKGVLTGLQASLK